MVSSALPSPSQFSALDTNSATDTLCFTLTSCLDNFCPLSSRPARATPSAPWLSDVLREHRAKLRAAERKWHKSKNSTDLSVYQSLPFFHSLQRHLSELCSTNSLCFLHRKTLWTTTNLASEVATQLRLPYSRLQRPWDWQEQLPNPLYSSCWICLLPLTQLTTRSWCPSSERWASQEPPSCGSSLTSQIGPSGCLGGVMFQSHNFLLLEFLKAQCLVHFSSPSTCRH